MLKRALNAQVCKQGYHKKCGPETDAYTSLMRTLARDLVCFARTSLNSSPINLASLQDSSILLIRIAAMTAKTPALNFCTGRSFDSYFC